MKIFNLYETILREEETTNGVQACISRYGKELFSPQFGGKEPNTEPESDTAQNVFNFTIDAYGKGLSSQFTHQVQDLKKCMNTFPDVLYPEGPAYRGLAISLNKFLNIQPDLKLSGHFRFQYESMSQIESWTQTFGVADDFAAASVNRYTSIALRDLDALYDGAGEEAAMHYIMSLMKDKEKLLNTFVVPIILKHDATPDQFLFKGKYFSQLSGDEDEDEILRIDPRPLMVAGMIHHEFVDRIMKLLPLFDKALS